MDTETLNKAYMLLIQQKEIDITARELYFNTINVKGDDNVHMRAPLSAVNLSDDRLLLGVNVGQRFDESTLLVENADNRLEEVYAAKLTAKDLLTITQIAAREQLPIADELSKAAIRQLRYDYNLKATVLPEYVQRENDPAAVIQRVDFRDMTAVLAVYPTANSSVEDAPKRMFVVLLSSLTKGEREAVAKQVKAYGGFRSMQRNLEWIIGTKNGISDC